ncbi:VOC family protein [Mesorhizobium sp. M0938]|uniref:VOC family protein n=1 Tax=unclassified Mesorhizobium TaxID=325217 RepID=UPI003339E464
MLHLPIDHVVLVVPDLDRAGQAFEAGGFHVTEKAAHSTAMGTANRCIMLDGTYIELMGIVTETPSNLPWRTLLDMGQGIRGLAFRSTDISASGKELTQANIAIEQTRHFSRETSQGELRFSVVRIDPAETPGLQCLVCQHHTAERLWTAQSMRHPNGAVGLQSLDVSEIATLYRLAAVFNDGGVAVASGNGRLVLAGHQPNSFDLRSACGVEIEVVGQ